jgi:hypothetical protein
VYSASTPSEDTPSPEFHNIPDAAAKEETKPLVKFWFKYGLTLCAMGMMQEEKRRLEAKRGEAKKGGKHGNADSNGDADISGENLDKIGAYSSGLARVIVPVIRALYRGPQPA